MSNATETAKDWVALVGGVPVVGVMGLLVYIRSTLEKAEREPQRGWLTLAAGVVLVGWLALFVVLAAPAVWKSWRGHGAVEPALVLLSGTWVSAIVLVAVSAWNIPKVLTYVDEAYPPDTSNFVVQAMRRISH